MGSKYVVPYSSMKVLDKKMCCLASKDALIAMP